MKDGFKLTIETVHAPDRGTQENAHQLPPELLKLREVVNIDIANDPVQVPRDLYFQISLVNLIFMILQDYKPDEDPKTFLSKKTGRGQLKGDWQVCVLLCMYCVSY